MEVSTENVIELSLWVWVVLSKVTPVVIDPVVATPVVAVPVVTGSPLDVGVPVVGGTGGVK